MKTLQEILVELQALSTVTEDQFETALSAVVADLQAVVDAPVVAPVADPVATVETVTDGGVTETFVPEAEPTVEAAPEVQA